MAVRPALLFTAGLALALGCGRLPLQLEPIDGGPDTFDFLGSFATPTGIPCRN